MRSLGPLWKLSSFFLILDFECFSKVVTNDTQLCMFFLLGCLYVGQFLTNPADPCSFLVCDFGNEPWQDESGNIKLFSRFMPCAPGTFVLSDYQGDTYSERSPCTVSENNNVCAIQSKKFIFICALVHFISDLFKHPKTNALFTIFQ